MAAAGLLAGFAFLAVGDDQLVRRMIGAILLAMVAVTLWRRRRTTPASGPLAVGGYGASPASPPWSPTPAAR
ncbi:hypothetical protein [Microbacterium sp. EF45047]|uniref:hypothetical protein n=1 Tax=Microbacterium sp. EF45047 TaxID=2809708 RepID=UPI00300E24F1